MEKNNEGKYIIDFDLLPLLVDSKKSILKNKYPNVYKNLIENCDANYAPERIFAMWKIHLTINDYVIDIVKDKQKYSPVILINSYLLRARLLNDHLNEANALMSRYDYLALSASVYFSINTLENKSIGEILGSGYSDNETKAVQNFSDERYINTVRNTVYANIANVPLYYINTNSQVVFKTMNEAFSTSTKCMYYFCRAIKSSNPEYTHQFLCLDGVPYSADKAKAAGYRDIRSNAGTEKMYASNVTKTFEAIPVYANGKKNRLQCKAFSPMNEISTEDLEDILISQPEKNTNTIWYTEGPLGDKLDKSRKDKKEVADRSDFSTLNTQLNNMNLISLLEHRFMQEIERKKGAKFEEEKSLIAKRGSYDSRKKLERPERADLSQRERSKIVIDICARNRDYLNTDFGKPVNPRIVKGADVESLLTFTFSPAGKSVFYDGDVEVKAENKVIERVNDFLRMRNL